MTDVTGVSGAAATPGGPPSPRRNSPRVPGATLRRSADLPALFARRMKVAAPKRRTVPRVFVYTRFSTDRQEEKSEERQLADARACVTRMRGSVARVFSDRGVSGTTMAKRLQLRAMMEAVRRGECDVVLVEDLDRLSRRLADLMCVFDELEDRGIELHDTLNGKLDRVHVVLRGYVGEEGRMRFLALSKAGKRNAVRNGRIMQKPAYGFRTVKGEKGVQVVDAKASTVVLRIVRDVAAGVSSHHVARSLTTEGVPPPSQAALVGPDGKVPDPRKWNAATILNIVRNPIYIGWVVYGATTPRWDRMRHVRTGRDATEEADWIVLEVPEFAFVDREVWERANLSLLGPSYAKGNSAGKFLLTGKLRCAECGSPMKACLGPSDTRYVCSGRMDRGPDHCGHAANPRLDLVEGVVVSTVAREFLTPAAVALYEDVLRRRVAELAAGDQARRAQILRRSSAIHLEIKVSFAEHATAEIVPKRVARIRRELEEEDEALQAELAALRHPDDLTVGLRSVETLRGKTDRILTEVPFRPRDAAGIELKSAFRDILREVSIGPPDNSGEAVIEMRIDLLAAPGAAGDDPCTEVVLRASLNTRKIAEAQIRETLEDRVAGRNDAAADGRHDLSDEEWAIVEPHFAGFRGRRVEPRALFDGMICLAREGGPVMRMPERYGGARFGSAAMSFVTGGRFDAAVASLRAGDAPCLRDIELACFASAVFVRRSAVRKPDPAVVGEDRRKLMAIVRGVPPGGIAALRCQAVELMLSGLTLRQAAGKLSVGRGLVNYAWETYLREGVEALRPRRCNRTRLTPTQFSELAAIARTGVDPDDPDKTLTTERLCAICQERFGVTYLIKGLGQLLRLEGIHLGAIVAAARRRARLRQTGQDEGRETGQRRRAAPRPGSLKHRRATREGETAAERG